MFKFIQALFLAAVLLVTGCGGGSDSGGGSGQVFTGTYSIHLNSGSALASGSGTFTAVVRGDVVTITFDDGTVFTAEFAPVGVASSDSRNIVGVVEGCTSGTIKVTILSRPDDGTIGGIIVGDAIVCDGASFQLTGTLTGTLSQ